MNRLERQMIEYRELRDTARGLFRKELRHARHAVTPRAIGRKIAGRIGAELESASDASITFARSHAGKLAAASAAGAAAVGLWLAREPIRARLAALFARDKGKGGTDQHPDEDVDNE